MTSWQMPDFTLFLEKKKDSVQINLTSIKNLLKKLKSDIKNGKVSRS